MPESHGGTHAVHVVGQVGGLARVKVIHTFATKALISEGSMILFIVFR